LCSAAAGFDAADRLAVGASHHSDVAVTQVDRQRGVGEVHGDRLVPVHGGTLASLQLAVEGYVEAQARVEGD
jgi:hypothetical protein